MSTALTLMQLTVLGLGTFQLGFQPSAQAQEGQPPGTGPSQSCTPLPQPVEIGYTRLTVQPLVGELFDMVVSADAGRQIIEQLRANGGSEFVFGLGSRWYRTSLAHKRHPGEFILHTNQPPEGAPPATTTPVGLASHWDIFEVESPFPPPAE